MLVHIFAELDVKLIVFKCSNLTLMYKSVWLDQ